MLSGTRSQARPRLVTFLALGVLTIAGFYSARFGLALLRWQQLESFAGVSAAYIALTGLGMALWAWPAFVGLWRGYSWAVKLTLTGAAAYTVYFWLDRLWVSNAGSGFLPVNTPFGLGVTILGWGYILYTFTRKTTKAFFGEVS